MQNDHAAENDTATIAKLNDALRAFIHMPLNNMVVMTQGVASLIGGAATFQGQQRQMRLLTIVRDYDDFGPDNDPHGERDFGTFEFQDTKCFWKIDYYDRSMKHGSPNPADPSVTCRVLTILTALEY